MEKNREKTKHEKRVNISLSDEMLTRLDYYSALFGIPRASMCTMLIGQGIVAWDKSLSVTETMISRLNEQLSQEIQKRVVVRVAGSEGDSDSGEA